MSREKPIKYAGIIRELDNGQRKLSYSTKKKNKGKNDFVVKGMYEMYKTGKSLEYIGKKYNKTRQSVWGNFKYRGFELRTKKVYPAIYYKGQKYTASLNGYFRATTRQKHILLHRLIWEEHNGKLNKKDYILHRDKNKANNDITNLFILKNCL